MKFIKKPILRHLDNCVNIPFKGGKILEVNKTHVFFEFENYKMAWFCCSDKRCQEIISKLPLIYKHIIYELSLHN